MNWKGWGGTYKTPVNGKDSFLVIARDLPKLLEEQAEHSEFSELSLDIGKGNIGRLRVWDSAGRKWYVPKKDMNQLRTDIEKYAELRDPTES